MQIVGDGGGPTYPGRVSFGWSTALKLTRQASQSVLNRHFTHRPTPKQKQNVPGSKKPGTRSRVFGKKGKFR